MSKFVATAKVPCAEGAETPYVIFVAIYALKNKRIRGHYGLSDVDQSIPFKGTLSAKDDFTINIPEVGRVSFKHRAPVVRDFDGLLEDVLGKIQDVDDEKLLAIGRIMFKQVEKTGVDEIAIVY